MATKRPNPSDELSFKAEHFKAITPYTSTKNANGESAKFQFSIDADLAREIDTLITQGLQVGIPYKNRGDFARDAAYKWLLLVREMVQPGATARNPLYQLENHIQREAAEASARHNMDVALDLIGTNLPSYAQEAAYDQIAMSLITWVDHISALERGAPYWFRRWRRKFCENPEVQKAVKLLEAHVDPDLPVLHTIRGWQEAIRV